MPNKQKMQNYDYFDFLDFKDRSDRDRIAVQPQDRDPFYFGSRSWGLIAIRKKFGSQSRSDRELQH